MDNFLPFSSNLKLSSANSFSLEESKICHLLMGLIMDNFLKNCLERVEEFEADILVFFLFTKGFFHRVIECQDCVVKS